MARHARVTLIALLLVLAPSGADDGKRAKDPSTEGYLKALHLQRRGRWKSARKAFRRLIKKYPMSPHIEDALNRSGDNAYLGTTVLWRSGPAARRIDIAVMGDGFTIDSGDQKKQKKWAQLCLDDVFQHEKSLSEYRNYFNIYFVRLASLEEGVDPNYSPDVLAKIAEKNKYRSKSRQKRTEYNTALDAKAAGPQGQVMMNPGQVYKWLDIAGQDVKGCDDDRQVIAFAQFGRLGMGGGGIANVGRPDKSITTHEFGHSFSRLLDEYQGNPNPPLPPAQAMLRRAPNAAVTENPKEVPWAHMIKKRIKGVGVYEGGATYSKGVWRPAQSCAMNAAGNNQYCPVCREQTIKVIYEYVNPIDTSSPPTNLEVTAIDGDDTQLLVTPMRPRKRRLKVFWHVKPLAVDDESGPEPPQVDEESHTFEDIFLTRRRGGYGFGGQRGRKNRDGYDQAPEGDLSKLGKDLKGTPRRHVFPVGKLEPGRYQITVEVKDTTKWVIKDEKHLLEERLTWWVRVSPKPAK